VQERKCVPQSLHLKSLRMHFYHVKIGEGIEGKEGGQYVMLEEYLSNNLCN
jgi:hypothetical protein